MPVELRIPEVGESITEVQIGAWLKNEGDSVERDEALVEIESDKATLELPAPVSGTLSQVLKKKGETARVGDLIATIGEGQASGAREGAAARVGTPPRESATPREGQAAREEAPPTRDVAPSKPAPAGKSAPNSPPTAAPPAPPASAPASAAPRFTAPGHGQASRVMPSAKRILEKEGLSEGDVAPTGPGGRLLKEDVLDHLARQPGPGDAAVKAAPPAAKATPAKPAQPRAATPGAGVPPPWTPPADAHEPVEEAVPMSPMRIRIAERLKEAQNTAALLTTFNEIDMSQVIALREDLREAFQERFGVKLGFMSFFVKAAIDALMQFPQVNAEIRGKEIVYRNFYDIGIAVGGGKGLVVPVLRGAERMSFAEIEMQIADFAARAKENKLTLDELKGGTFTISNGGVYGSLLSTPIINPPQSGILGLHAIQKRPVALNDQVVIRPMMYVALTYDHRIVDGRESVTFLKHIKDLVERPARMLLGI